MGLFVCNILQVEAPETTWGHDMYEGHGAANPGRSNKGPSGIETGTKLFINNLDYGVSNEDIKVTFVEFTLEYIGLCSMCYDVTSHI